MRAILFLLCSLTCCPQIIGARTFTSLHDSLPTISCPGSLMLSTGTFDCIANHTFSVTVLDDTSGWTLVQTAGLPSGADFPLGETFNQFMVTDLDGNTATCSFTVSVKDYAPPVAICDGALTVSISGGDDSGDCYLGNAPSQFAGVNWVNAATFDNGSYDYCGNIRLTIRRMFPYSNFIQTLNPVNGHPPCNDLFPDFPSEFERAISEQDSIKFYCAEANLPQTVVLTVYQLDPDGNISIGPDGVPIYNQCLTQVTVADKIKPTCIPPAEVTVSCEQFDPSLIAYGAPTLTDNCCIDHLNKSVNYNQFDTICNRGTLTRLFQAFDCSGNSSACSQRVVVNYVQHYYLKFPDDTLATVCNSTGIYGRPTFFGEDCELMGVSYEDQIFGLPVVDACFKIERTWTIINWCNYDPNLPLIYVPNPTLVNTPYTVPQNTPGPVVSDCNALAPWAPTISKITPNDTVETNFCTFWKANSNGYRYRQIVKIQDASPPAFLNCPVSPVVFADISENNPFYWNNVFNPALPSQNLSEAPADLSITATDSCSGNGIYVGYLLFLDLDGDGTQETVVDSRPYPPLDSVYYGNAQNPNYAGGVGKAFDTRPILQNQKWRFVKEDKLSGNNRITAVRWNTAQSPNTYIVPQLPVGTHRIKWLSQDGCGNESVCEYPFTIQAPALSCLPPPDVTVSCENFDPSLMAYGQPSPTDSCCIENVTKSANYSQFDTICQRGTITRSFLVYDCSGGTNLYTQRVVVNYRQDYYIKFPNDVVLTDCNGSGVYGEPVFFGEDCELLAVSYEDFSEPGIPDACYKFERSWTVINWCTYNPLLPVINIPNPNPNPITNHPANLPGPIVSACGTMPPWASTVVKINPTDPVATDFCTFWNASANGYRYKQFIKILDSTAPTFSNCAAPPLYWADSTQNDPELWNNVFNPSLPVQDLQESPVDLSVTVIDACSGSNVNIEYLLFLDLDADSQMETVVNSTALGIAGLGWNNVQYNNIATPNFAGGTPTAFDDRPVPLNQKWGFSIQESVNGTKKTASVRWNTAQSPNTHILPALPNGSHKIKWFATDGCGNNSECEQFFSIGDTTLVGTHELDKDGFALYQNEPNPFSGKTVIRFDLPAPTAATLSVFDAEGRILYRRTADYSPGTHAVRLENNLLGSAGVLFYKLEAGAHVAWKKMIVLR